MNAIVIGGGIGGLACAIAMTQCGICAKVYEKTPQLQAVGAGIGLGINAMRVLKDLGVADKVIERGNRLHKMQIRTPKGQILSSVDICSLEKQLGIPAITIHRADLHQILVEALPENTLHLGKELINFEQDASQITALFKDGHKVYGELLVGSDGIHSQVRKIMFGDEQLRDARQMCWRGIADGSNIHAPHFCVTWGKGIRFGFVRVNKTQIYWFCTINHGIGEEPIGKQPLLDIFSEWCDPIPQILENTPAKGILRNDLFDRISKNTWYNNRVVLLGDAIHPTTPNMGQGACMAIESAKALANCLQQHSLPQALQSYQHLRKQRTKNITTQSWRVGKMATLSNPLLIQLRNALIRLTPEFIPRRRLRQVFDYHI